MKKEFNDTGLCIPEKHYYVDTSSQLEETFEYIERGKYFIINRPRQYGKTTTFHLINQQLLNSKEYLPIKISFEGIDDSPFESKEIFCPFFLKFLSKEFNIKKLGLSKVFTSRITPELKNFDDLSDALTDIMFELDKKVILLIDEVDKSSNNQLFLHFLGMLRNKYLLANVGEDKTFHSVILAGLHDVKNLKLKLRPDENAVYNSPWNIAADYKVDLSFSASQIETMLMQYKNETKTLMDTKELAEEIYFYTSGYPYFVSKLCKIIDEEIRPEKWKKFHVVEAVKIILLLEDNSNFGSLIKNLEDNKELRDLAEMILLGSKEVFYEPSAKLINIGRMHGIFRASEDRKVVIYNKIYEEKVTNYLLTTFSTIKNSFNSVQSPFLKPDGKLDMKHVLQKFQEVIKEKYSKTDHLKSDEFLENNLRMLFLVFLKPIINGTGFSFKEVQTSAERRLDIVVLFKDEKFIVELKMWYGEKYHIQGIEQIKDYMSRENVDEGYMIIMSKNKDKQFTSTDENGLFTIWL